MAGLMYMGDNNQSFPSGENEWLYAEESFTAEHPSGCRWHDMAMAPGGKIMTDNPEYKGKLWYYMNPETGRVCPQFRSIAASRGCENPNHLDSITINPQYSYTINGYLGTEKSGGVLTLSQVRNPVKVFFFAEENSWTLRPDHPKYPAPWLDKPLSNKALDDTMLSVSSISSAQDCFATYHDAPSGDLNKGSCDASFIDGHADSISIEQQLKHRERGWPPDTFGNLSYAWAAKDLPDGDMNAQ